MIKVVAALIENDNKVLLARRSTGDINVLGKWEFPGGKVEQDEDEFKAIERETDEWNRTCRKTVAIQCDSQFHSSLSSHKRHHSYLCQRTEKYQREKTCLLFDQPGLWTDPRLFHHQLSLSPHHRKPVRRESL